jgi:RNA polymerase sigma-70 factor (ECF subfamily)
MMGGAELDLPFETRLIDECAVGDAPAWRELHRRYFPICAAFLRKLGVLPHDVEDATQEVFLQVHRYLPSFRREAELSTWIYRICISEARVVRRRARVSQALRRLLSLERAETLVSSPGLPEDVARSRVERALDALSSGERDVFVLYEMEGLPGRQIAEILGVPEATVWRRLHYARRSFRTALVGTEAPPPTDSPAA